MSNTSAALASTHAVSPELSTVSLLLSARLEEYSGEHVSESVHRCCAFVNEGAAQVTEGLPQSVRLR